MNRLWYDKKGDYMENILTPLFELIDKKLEDGRVILAIDGRSAGGKTTLGTILKNKYNCTVLHTDDFFLQPHQRTDERLSETGGNLDRERFLEEVLLPLSRNETFNYRRFDCSAFTFEEPVIITPGKLTVIEGAYSMHPDLAPFYTASAFIDVSPEMQKERIIKRNPPHSANLFFTKWIPMENRFIEEMQINQKCDIIIENT